MTVREGSAIRRTNVKCEGVKYLVDKGNVNENSPGLWKIVVMMGTVYFICYSYTSAQKSHFKNRCVY